MTEITAAERAFIDLIRHDSLTINTVIGYTRYHGKTLRDRATTDYERTDADRLLKFAAALEAAADDWRAHL